MQITHTKRVLMAFNLFLIIAITKASEQQVIVVHTLGAMPGNPPCIA